jgi:hypothetical protein
VISELGRAVAIAALVGLAIGAKPGPPVPLAPPPPLATLPSIARVKVTDHGSAIAVVEEVNLPRGEWKGEALHFHVAFGSPGPRAIDARLVPVGDGALEAEDDEAGEALASERVPRRPANAHLLLGRDSMAGIVIHLRSDSLTKALARGNMAAIRIRTVVEATELDASGASSVVVRLGATRATPLTLGRIAIGAGPGVPATARAEARLCGADADPHPLAVGLVVNGVTTRGPAPGEPPIAPVLAVRHPSDDLCLRWWRAGK